MDADDLRIVDAVARIGSMNRAAAELNMMQPNVTARIRLLEDELGVQLFVSHSRGAEPSAVGLRLLSYGELQWIRRRLRQYLLDDMIVIQRARSTRS